MKPFIGIGITTYLDISSTACGAAIFDAYQTSAPSLSPDQVRVRSLRFPVSNAQDFASHWSTNISFDVREYRERAQLVEKGNQVVGAEWRRKGRGGGRVEFRPELQNDRPDMLLIKHPYSVRPDWLGLFRRLVDIARPSYAMLHLFTEREVDAPKQDRFEVFDGPFAGEEHFVSWRSSLGEWRRPDQWEHEARRTYRFLPDLSWANFLGPEFQGQFDKGGIARNAAQFQSIGMGVMFSVTPDISDIIKEPEHFASSRRILRNAFGEGFFRL